MTNGHEQQTPDGEESQGARRRVVRAADAPAALGPYSHAATALGTGLIYLSGQTPVDPTTGAIVDGGFAAQVRQVFRNLDAVLSAAGATFAEVVKVNVYLTTMTDFAELNAIYAEVFDEPYPARSTVAVAELPLGARVEVEVVAAAP